MNTYFFDDPKTQPDIVNPKQMYVQKYSYVECISRFLIGTTTMNLATSRLINRYCSSIAQLRVISIVTGKFIVGILDNFSEIQDRYQVHLVISGEQLMQLIIAG